MSENFYVWCILGTAHDLCAVKSCVDVTLGCPFIDFTYLIQSITVETVYKRCIILV